MKKFSLLSNFKDKFENVLLKELGTWKEAGPLKKACLYSLSGGKRLRPIIVLMIGDALGGGALCNAALAMEFFHTASLIADDLPSMDDDEKRRGVLTLHKVFGEATALLASYTLISKGYELLAKSRYELKENLENADKVVLDVILEISKLAGIEGVTGGQYLDLYPKDDSIETIEEIIRLKTETLFESCFVLGWFFSGGDGKLIFKVKEAAHHLGKAFQIADDIHDMKEDQGLNIAKALGKDKAFLLYLEEMKRLKSLLSELKLLSPSFLELMEYISSFTKEQL